MSIGILHIIGIIMTIALIIGVGIYSGTKVSGDSDFSTGGQSAGPWIVCGTIMGALVSGQATIGTAQLAYLYGLSAWWFTLGSGIGCAILAWGYAKPMRQSGATTLMEVIAKEYGPRAEGLGSVLSSIGIIISIISQVVSACALITTLFDVDKWLAITIAAVLMIIYVIFGGVWGAGMGGIVKLLLLYGVSIIGLFLVLMMTKGASGLLELLDHTLLKTEIANLYDITNKGDVSQQYMNLTARGISKDVGSGISLVLGVLSTQTYAQAIWSAKTDDKARKGSLLAAFLIPPIGITCIAIGLFMRGHCITAEEMAQLTEMGKVIPQDLIQLDSTAQVFPAFIVHYMPKLIGGVALGTLLITIVGGGAGLSLGVSVILVEDILAKLSDKINDERNKLIVTRVVIIVVLFAAALIGGMASDAIINDMGFLSMGLRGAVVVLPFSCALFLKGRIKGEAVIASMIGGPVAVIVGNLIDLPFDPLFLGIAVNMICCLAGYRRTKEIG
ncbi:Acetate transporter ActP [uncultured Eubacterium sp.]|nr:Acetate transporter ActP [uncultured Eubacterium sp.]